MFKKIFIAFILLLVLLFGAIIAVPYLFKDKLIAIAKTEMNNYLNADADFKDVDISILRSFPNLSFSLIKLTVVNHEPFKGDTLAQIDELAFTLDIMPILKSNLVAINSVSVVNPDFRVKVLEDGTASYDIVKETDAPEKEVAPETETASDIRISLKKYSIENAQITYDDVQGKMLLVIRNLNHSGEGDFTLEQFNLITETRIDELSFKSDGVDYLKKGRLEMDLTTFIDLAQSSYEIKDNRLKLNELELKLSGLVKELPEDAYDLDLKFNTPTTDFKSLLSLIPAIYMTDFQDLKADGNFSLKGDLKGEYKDESYPAFNLGLKVDNGTFQYPDLPAAVRQVFIDLAVNSPGGDLNNMVIDLKQLKMKLGEEPIDIKALVRQPMLDPLFDLTLFAQVNLANVKNYYPLEEELTGNLDMNLTAKGKVSTLETERYEEFDATGTVRIRNMTYETTDLPLPVNIQDFNLAFNPNKVDLKNLALNIGKSDLKAAGSLENFFAYSLGTGKLKGQLDLASDFLDLNELMGVSE
ncbi:MAG: AsmA family protein, partial [Chitinophagales bacterium]